MKRIIGTVLMILAVVFFICYIWRNENTESPIDFRPVLTSESAIVEKWQRSIKPSTEIIYLHLAKQYVLALQEAERNNVSLRDSVQDYLLIGYNPELDESEEKTQSAWGVKEWIEYNSLNERYVDQVEWIATRRREYLQKIEESGVNLQEFRQWYNHYIAQLGDPVEYIDYRFKTLNE